MCFFTSFVLLRRFLSQLSIFWLEHFLNHVNTRTASLKDFPLVTQVINKNYFQTFSSLPIPFSSFEGYWDGYCVFEGKLNGTSASIERDYLELSSDERKEEKKNCYFSTWKFIFLSRLSQDDNKNLSFISSSTPAPKNLLYPNTKEMSILKK